MASNIFVGLVNNVRTFITAISQSAGVADANKIVSTDATGKLHISLMPTGVDSEALSVPVSEALSAGDFVNLYNVSGTLTARKADASNGRLAHGFVLAAVAAGTATVYQEGLNTALSGLTIGVTAYLGTAGSATVTPPSYVSGRIYQELGYTTSASAVLFQFSSATPYQ
ncbi:MAG: hypothetical protein KME13_25080 [Myxacorys californica WJT36-NPBG1]|jgi:hypothetical protein|nr:hypothetical protein [Myxacorys californica WJT36-NPBG1]